MVAPQPGGRFVATNATLAVLVQWAYDLQDFQIEGGANWTRSDRFDIIARAPEDAPGGTSAGVPSRTQLMLQSLLADRFGLVLRRDTRDRQVYALVMARPDRRPGPQLEATRIDCSTASASGSIPTRRTSSGAAAFACGVRTGAGALNGGNMTMTDLAAWLSSSTDQLVLDRTELSGRWNVDLTWAPVPSVGLDAAPLLGAANADRPALFTAVQEQLGLKLEAIRAPIEVLVIDRVEQPTPD